jgi:hypothetical protein
MDSAQVIARFEAETNLANQSFQGVGHWPMIDCSSEFYSFLAKWVSEQP